MTIPQDKDRFSKLKDEGRAPLPPGYSAPLDFKPTRTLIAERLRACGCPECEAEE